MHRSIGRKKAPRRLGPVRGSRRSILPIGGVTAGRLWLHCTHAKQREREREREPARLTGCLLGRLAGGATAGTAQSERESPLLAAAPLDEAACAGVMRDREPSDWQREPKGRRSRRRDRQADRREVVAQQ